LFRDKAWGCGTHNQVLYGVKGIQRDSIGVERTIAFGNHQIEICTGMLISIMRVVSWSKKIVIGYASTGLLVYIKTQMGSFCFYSGLLWEKLLM